LIGLLAVLAATNRWEGWTAGMRLLSARDEAVYRRIALAAPHPPQTRLPNQNAQEFVCSYVVGLVAHLLGIDVESAFRAAVVAVILGICIGLHVALGRSGVSTPAYAVCATVLILNTYSLRYYLIAPGILADVAFVLAITLVLNALIAGRYVLAVVLIALAMLTRQSAVPVGLALAWWVTFAPGWRAAPARVRLRRAVVIVLTPVVVYLTIIAVASPFSSPTTPGIVDSRS